MTTFNFDPGNRPIIALKYTMITVIVVLLGVLFFREGIHNIEKTIVFLDSHYHMLGTMWSLYIVGGVAFLHIIMVIIFWIFISTVIIEQFFE